MPEAPPSFGGGTAGTFVTAFATTMGCQGSTITDAGGAGSGSVLEGTNSAAGAAKAAGAACCEKVSIKEDPEAPAPCVPAAVVPMSGAELPAVGRARKLCEIISSNEIRSSGSRFAMLYGV